ncbi:MAG: ABC transporter ATP-binding protein [Candidatus Hydrogenedentes bacterium]|nr:ABC transporter ATP-binding protein [Candidatus Hydrogenedentota bacterium]
MSESQDLLTIKTLTKEFPGGGGPVKVLDGVSLTVRAGESLSVVGPSGSGKSTLLNIIGALDQPTAGEVLFEGRNIAALGEKELAQYRNRSVGFVFQLHHLLPQCTVLENVLIPTLAAPTSDDARTRALHLLGRVGLEGRIHARPGVLSGGERQRSAVVRALINRPRVLLADEPTGSLNPESAEELARLMIELNREEGMALIVVTHSPAIARMMGRTFLLQAGRLVEQS